jgi:polysaccharide export outer membrane protein
MNVYQTRGTRRQPIVRSRAVSLAPQSGGRIRLRLRMSTRTLSLVFLGAHVLCASQAEAIQRAAAEAPLAPPADIAGAKPDTPSPARSQLQTRNPRYQVRPADVLDILFAPTTEFNQSVAVQPDGYITLREAKDIYVQGKTIPELTEAIGVAYANILRNPTITVVLKEFEKPHFIVGGKVEKPGKYELRADTTVSEAVAIAGSFTEKAKHSQVLLFRRTSDDWMEVRKVDLKAIFRGEISEDIHLRPGDMIYVPQNRVSKIKPFIPVWALSTYFPGRF